MTGVQTCALPIYIMCMKHDLEEIKQKIRSDMIAEQQASVNLLKDVSQKTEHVIKLSDMVARAIDEALNKSSLQQSVEQKLKTLDESIRDIKYGVLNEVRELQKAASYIKGRIEAINKVAEILDRHVDASIANEKKVEELAQKMKTGELDPDSAKRGNKRSPGQRPERLKNLREARKIVDEDSED